MNYGIYLCRIHKYQFGCPYKRQGEGEKDPTQVQFSNVDTKKVRAIYPPRCLKCIKYTHRILFPEQKVVFHSVVIVKINHLC